MFGLPPGTVEWLATGAVLTAAGAMIKFAGWTFLLAGYDESSSVPEDVVSNVAGTTVLRIGLAVTGFGALTAVTTLPEYAGLVVGGAIVLAVARLLYRLNIGTNEAAAS